MFTNQGKETIEIQNRISNTKLETHRCCEWNTIVEKDKKVKQDQKIQFNDKKCANLWN